MRRAVLVLALAACSTSSAPAVTSGDGGGGAGDDASNGAPTDAGAGDADAYVPPTDAPAFAWREVAPCPVPRFEAMGGVVDGKLLVMGGFVSASLDKTRRVHLYDPATDSWSERSPLPEAPEHCGVAIDGTTVYLVGGLDPMNAHLFVHDFLRDTYFPGPSMNEARAALALLLWQGTLHAIGGLAADNATDSPLHTTLPLAAVADAGASWTTLASTLPNPRNHLGAAVVGDRLYVVGGRHGWDEQAGNQATLSVYDPAADAWSAGPDIPLARSEIAGATFAHGGRLVVVGGAVDPAKPTDRVDVYDPATNAWTELPPLPGPRKGAVAAALGDAILVSTGSPTGVDPSGTTWIGCCF